MFRHTLGIFAKKRRLPPSTTATTTTTTLGGGGNNNNAVISPANALLTAIASLDAIYTEYQQHRNSGGTLSDATGTGLREKFVTELPSTEALCNVSTLVAIPDDRTKHLLRMIRGFQCEDKSKRFRTLEMVLGQVPRTQRQREALFVGGYFAPDSFQNSRVSEREPSAPGEQPVPPDYAVREKLVRADTSKMRYYSDHIPHWILADPTVALSKAERKIDP
eukprot:PhF_6_TR17374/c0_g1_i2/m.26607